MTQVEAGTVDFGAPVMGLQGADGEVLAGDPIPLAPGETIGGSSGSTTGGVNNASYNYDGAGNNAIVKDGNLWDSIVADTAAQQQTIVLPGPTPTPQPEGTTTTVTEPTTTVTESTTTVVEPKPDNDVPLDTDSINGNTGGSSTGGQGQDGSQTISTNT